MTDFSIWGELSLQTRCKQCHVSRKTEHLHVMKSYGVIVTEGVFMVKGVEGVVTHSGGGREIVLSHSCLVHGHSVPERGGLHHFDSRVKTFCEERKKRSQISQWGLSNNSMKYNGKMYMCHKVKVGMGNRNFHRTAISTFRKADSYSVAKRKQEVQDVRSCN